MYSVCENTDPYVNSFRDPVGKNLISDVLASNCKKCPFCGDNKPILYRDFFSCSSCGRRGNAKAFMRMLGY